MGVINLKIAEEYDFESILKKNIRYLRKKRGYSQIQLAQKLGVAKSTISSYESHSTDTLPSVFKLKNIARYLGVTIDEIVTYDLEERDKKEEKNRENISKSLLTITNNTLTFNNPVYEKFLNHNYWVYFLKTDKNDTLHISYADMFIEQNKIKERYDINFNINRDKHYNGIFVLTYTQIYIYLQGKYHYERALMIFNNPQNGYNKPYIGGLGVISSVSSGSERNPCIQKILITNIEISKNEYKNGLTSLLSFSSKTNDIVKIDDEIEKQAYRFIKKLNKIE